MKKLVVMVSIYESGQFIENRIKNLLNSDILDDIEIWCVNANSPDPVDDIIPQQHPVVYRKLPERITVYETWNYIIENSQSEFLTIANTDDLVAPNCYSKLLSSIEKGKDFSYCSWYKTTTPGRTWDQVKKGHVSQPGDYRGIVEKATAGHFPVWRRSLHDKLGLFDPRFKALSDADWWARCFYKGGAKFYWLREALGCYLWRDGQNLWNRMINAEEWNLYHSKLKQYMSERVS